MIEIRKVTDKEKKNFVNADYVIHFGGAKRYFTEKAIEELRCKLNKLLLDDVIKCAFDCENPVFEKGASYCKMHMEIDDWS